MSKYNFTRANDNVLSIRMDKETGDAIRAIAKKEKTTVHEICRVFLREALRDYQKENSDE